MHALDMPILGTMIPLIAKILVLAGAVILVAAWFPVRRLIVRLPQGIVRNRWYIMAALIVLFLGGYLGYAVAFWNGHSGPLDLIVPGVFFFGACFVRLTATLSLQTAMDVMRINLLEQEAVTDALTGLLNRRYLDRRLREEVARSRRYALPLSALLLDIDLFKQINDRHGHQAGDLVLLELAKMAPESLREADILMRYGGEEFLILAPNTALYDARLIAERLRKSIESHDFELRGCSNGATLLRLTVSIGVASLGDRIDSAEKLIRATDENLYRAKRQGRNRVVADTPGSQEAAPASPPP